MDAFRSSSQRRFYSFRFENTCCRWVQKSLVFRLTDSTAIVFAFVISEERSLVIQLILSMLPSKVSYWFTKGITLQKRTQLLILKIENRTQTQRTNHFVTGVFVQILTWTPQSSSKSLFDTRGSSSSSWTVQATSIYSLLEYDASQVSVKLPGGRYTSLSDKI